MIFNISLPDCWCCVLQTICSVPWQSLSHVDTWYLMSWCLLWILPFTMVIILLVVNPLPFTVVVGVSVVHCLLCTVISVCCGPSNWHHGSVYCLSVEPCTLYLGSHLWLCGPTSLLHCSHSCLLWGLYCVPWWSMASMVHPFTLYHGGLWCLLLTCHLETWGSLGSTVDRFCLHCLRQLSFLWQGNFCLDYWTEPTLCDPCSFLDMNYCVQCLQWWCVLFSFPNCCEMTDSAEVALSKLHFSN
jgi:hypothetical protein